VLDHSGYEAEHENAFVNLSFLAGPRVEVFATTMYQSGKAAVKDFA
jgi:hypothetical protein